MKIFTQFDWRLILLRTLTAGIIPLAGIDGAAQELDPAPHVILSSGSAVVDTSASHRLNRGVVREIDDPNLGTHWLLMLDPRNHGGPGVLIPIGPNHAYSTRPGSAAVPPVALPPGKPIDSATRGMAVFTDSFEEDNKPDPPVLRSGDRVVIEEHTPVADATLDAVALSSSVLGGIFSARLEAGGAIVRVVALGPGRAGFAPGGQR